MLTLPERVRRKKQPYLSIRTRLTLRHVYKQAQLFFPELRQYMQSQGIPETGLPFLRHNLISSGGELEMEFGLFTDKLYPGSGPMRSGMMPGGTFTSVTWKGHYDRLYDAHAMLTGWGRLTGADWDAQQSEAGVQYACRLSLFKQTARQNVPLEQWETELAILHK